MLPQGRPEGSLSSINSSQVISNQIINKGVVEKSIDDWVDEYENAPDAYSYDYLKASKG